MGIDVKGVLTICLREFLFESIVLWDRLGSDLLANCLNLGGGEFHIFNSRPTYVPQPITGNCSEWRLVVKVSNARNLQNSYHLIGNLPNNITAILGSSP